MSWSVCPFGGVLSIDAAESPFGVDVELEVITSDGLTWGMWVLADSNELLAVVAAAEA
jgi:hypothetical protein